VRPGRFVVKLAAAALVVLPSCAMAGILGGVFTSVGNDTQDRFFHRAGLLPNGFVMVTGGMRLQIFPSPTLISLNNISFFNPSTNSFSASFTPLGGGAPVNPTLAVARSSHTQTALLDGRVLITGGYTGASGTSQGTPTTHVELFDPQTGLMSAGPSMTAARAEHRAVRLPDGRVVVAGGFTWQLFDPVTNTWSADYPMQRARFSHEAVLLPDHAGPGLHCVLLVGGTGSGLHTMELLDPDSQTSTLTTAVLNEGVDDLGAARLDDGRILIVGGQSTTTGNTLGATYLYDPVADDIVAAPSPPNRPDGIADHQTIALGRFVLIFGGEQEVAGVDTELNYAALYDRATNTWPWQGTMNFIHDDFASAVLNDGRVLLIGGGVPLLGQEVPSRNAETFTPVLTLIGDVNNDLSINLDDVSPFVALLLDPSAANTQQYCAADANQDGLLDGHDVSPFTWLVLNP
jgi:hypothetical protein